MLEGSLHLSDVESTLPDVDSAVLGVFHAQTISLPLVTIALPASRVLLEVKATLSNRDPQLFIIEEGSVQLQEIEEVLSQISMVSAFFIVTPLQVVTY